MRQHFEPRYHPWDQRLLRYPTRDLFRAIREGRATWSPTRSTVHQQPASARPPGQDLPADIIVTATGLNLQLFGGADLHATANRLT